MGTAPPSTENESDPEVSSNAERILKLIEERHFRATGVRSWTYPNVDFKSWISLHEKHADSSPGYKLEYISAEKTLIVTYTSGVPGSARVLFKPVVDVAGTTSDFMIETNRDILTTSHAGWSLLTPDLAFGEEGVPIPKYRLIFECAWSQSRQDFESKMRNYFDDSDDVLAVVCLFLETSNPFGNPTFDAPADHIIQSAADTVGPSAQRSRLPFGPVNFLGHDWVEGISKVEMKVFFPGPHNLKKREFDLTPVESGRRTDISPLDSVQEEVDSLIAGLLGKAMSDKKLIAVLNPLDPQFTLNWEAFYTQLNKRMLADAYARYKMWAQPQLPVAIGSMRLAVEDAGAEDFPGDEKSETLVRKHWQKVGD
ncbi:hypothetical protein B0H11DRAFT_1959696 [Mycena galericulata]|nr:hypothetical protein B0H11DRAFT_1959696 [Mycena galericulata]